MRWLLEWTSRLTAVLEWLRAARGGVPLGCGVWRVSVKLFPSILGSMKPAGLLDI